MIRENLISCDSSTRTSGEQCSDDVESGVTINRQEDDIQWLQVFPPLVRRLKLIVASPSRSRKVKFFYGVMGVFLFFVGFVLPVVLNLEESDLAHYEDASTSFLTFFFMQFTLYLYFPFYYYPLIQDIFIGKDVSLLIKEAVTLSSMRRLKFKYYTVIHFNTFATAAGMIVYLSFIKEDIVVVLFTIFWFVFYIYPLSLVFGFLVCILEAHRIQAVHFNKEVVNMRVKYEESRTSTSAMVPCNFNEENQLRDSNCKRRDEAKQSYNLQPISSCPKSNVNSLEKDTLLLSISHIARHYLRLHDAFRETSDKRGVFIFSIFLVPVFILLSSIWSIYANFFSWKSTVGYIVMALFYLLEVGLTVSTVNETGNLACRDVSSFMLRVIVHDSCDGGVELEPKTIDKINGFVSCLVHIKIEIPFFGNFTLRSRTLIAIVVSLLGAIIPGIIRNEMYR